MPEAYPLTALAISLCSQWGVTPCTNWDLQEYWISTGGMCGSQSCYWGRACPNDVPSCFEPEKEECLFIATYPTIGSIDRFRADGTLDGPGGKAYLCRKREASIM